MNVIKEKNSKYIKLCCYQSIINCSKLSPTFCKVSFHLLSSKNPFHLLSNLKKTWIQSKQFLKIKLAFQTFFLPFVTIIPLKIHESSHFEDAKFSCTKKKIFPLRIETRYLIGNNKVNSCRKHQRKCCDEIDHHGNGIENFPLKFEETSRTYLFGLEAVLKWRHEKFRGLRNLWSLNQ